MKILIFIIFFLMFGAFFIISQQNIQLNSVDNIGLFFEYYFSWIDSLVNNAGVVTGYVVDMDWLPDE